MSNLRRAQRQLSRREFMLLSAGGLGSLALAGLAGRSSLAQGPDPTPAPTWTPGPLPAPNTALSGEVEIWGWIGVDDHFMLARDSGRYAQIFPNITVTTTRFSYAETHANILNALTSGIGVPDIVNFDVNYVGDFGAGMLDLTRLFEPYAEDFLPIVLNLATYQGSLVALPQDIEPMALAYRADIFEQYGITEDDLATWEGYVEAGRKLWRDSGETIKMISMDAPGSQMPVLGAPHQIHEVFLHLAGYHGVFFNKEDDAVIIDEPDAIAALEIFNTLTDPDVSWTFQTTDASLAAYQSGLVATNICPAWWMLGLSSQLADQSGLWRLMRLPALSEGGAREAFQIPTVTGIPLMSANANAAWAVLYDTQLTAEAQYRFWQATGGIMPTHLQVVDYLADLEIPYFGGQKAYGLLRDVLDDLPEVYFGRGWVEARAILTSRIEPIMRGEISVADGLRAAAAEMRRRLNKR